MYCTVTSQRDKMYDAFCPFSATIPREVVTRLDEADVAWL